MSDLRQIIQEIETRRKQRDVQVMSIALAGCLVLLVAVAVVAPAITKTPQPVAEAPKEYEAFDAVSITAKAAIVYDLTTGEVLYEKNAEAQLPLASLTKLLTLYAAAEALSPRADIVMSAKALSKEGDNGFTEGEVFAFEDLARLALVASSNDAAEAIAEAATSARHAANDTALLAGAAASVGLSQTYAVNGTGLDENGSISGGYGSARDIAILAGALVRRIPGIARASTETTVSASSLTGRSYTLKNTNQSVEHIPGLLLSKTGFTDLAGGNLAIVFDSGISHPIAIVVLGSTKEERFTDVNRLVAATAHQFSTLTLP